MERVYNVHTFERKLQGVYGVRGKTDKIQSTTRLENVCPEICTKTGEAAQKREKQEWVMEKPKLRQRSKVERHLLYEPDDGQHKGNQNCGENRKFPWRRLSLAKRGSRSKNTHRVRLT